MKNALRLIFSCLAVLSAGPASAQGSQPLLSQTVGSGNNESFLVVDFQDGTTHPSYAFGYRYSGTQYVSDEIAALANANVGFGLGYYAGYGPADGSSLGVAPTLFSYQGHSQNGGPGFGPSYYWLLWASADGADGDWTVSNFGASSTALTNGTYDAWNWNAGPAYPGPTPVTPFAAPAVPEAGAGWLLLLGLPVLLAACRGKRAAA